MKISYKLSVIVLIILLRSITLNSQNNTPLPQRTCGTPVLPANFETWLQPLLQSGPTGGRSVYTLPVIVHVIYNGEAIGAGSNISQPQIQSQLQILNEDFRKLNADISSVPSAWTGVAADCEINFCFAMVDPSGNVLTEPGINRVNRSTNGFTSPPYGTSYIDGTIKLATIWDPNNYLNVWCIDLGSSLLGYATFPNPGGSGLGGLSAPYGSATSDGVVIRNTAMGNTGTAAAPFNKGRTATHEIGHWLGLRHIWGDGSCANDYCNDTPTQQSSNNGCPSFPSVTCSNGPNGDMFINYMDYVNDNCMFMFSNDQKTRVQAIMSNSPMRMALANSIKCNNPVALDAGVTIITTPVGSICQSSITPTVTLKNFGSATLTSATISYTIDGGTAILFNWTGTLTSGSTANVTLPGSTAGAGAHTFSVNSSVPNGGTDGNPANDMVSNTFNIISAGQALPFSYGFEPITFPPTGWSLSNPDNLVAWARTTGAAKTGIASMWFNSINYTCNGCIEEVSLPNFDLTTASSPSLTFQVAYRLFSNPGVTPNWSDTLRVLLSNDCGQTWNQLYYKYSSNLTTIVPAYSTTAFIPGQADWRLETINLTSFALSNNVLIKFKVTSDFENNLYIDDINITGTSTNAGVSIATGTNPVCAGQSVTFAANATNSGSTPSYQWQVNGVNVGTDSPTYTTSTLTNGEIVTCIMTSNMSGVTGNPATSNSVTMTVVPAPSPSVSISASPGGSICAGTSVTFTANAVNAGSPPSYQWQLNGTNAGTNATYSNATLVNGDLITCQVVSSASCASPTTASSNIITIVVASSLSPSINITALPPGPVCSGTAVTFTAVPTNGGATPGYQWAVNGGSAGSNSSTFTSSALTNGAIVNITMTSSLSCANPATAISNNISAVVNSTPVTPGISQNGNVLTSSAATGNQWYLNGTPISGATSQTYTITQNGSYTVDVTDNGCTSAVSSSKTVLNLGILETDNYYFLKIHPNPSDGHFNISFKITSRATYTLELKNALGQLVYQEILTDFNGSYSKEINVTDYGKGIYLLSLSNPENLRIKKVMIY